MFIALTVVSFVVMFILVAVAPNLVEDIASKINVPAGMLVWLGSPAIGLVADVAFAIGYVIYHTDEFSLIPNLQHVDDAVNFGRSLGVKFMIGIQNIDQIYENYGENRARSLLSGFLTSVAFRVNDNSSKEFIKELHGENRKKEIYMSVVQSRGVVEQLREAHVVEDWDISTLGIGEAIIGLPGKMPFKFKFKKA